MLVVLFGVAACGGSAAESGDTSPAPSPAPAASVGPATGFEIVENGRVVVSPGADGSFQVDGPSRFTVMTDGTLQRDGAPVITRTGTQIAMADGAAIAQVTADGLRFESGVEIALAADGKVTAMVGGNPYTRETFEVRGLDDGNRAAVLTVLAFMFAEAPAAPPPAAGDPAGGDPAAATVADCRKVVDQAVTVGVMKGPEGPPPPEARDALAQKCVEAGMTKDGAACFAAAKNADDWAACDKKY